LLILVGGDISRKKKLLKKQVLHLPKFIGFVNKLYFVLMLQGCKYSRKAYNLINWWSFDEVLTTNLCSGLHLN